MCVIESCGVFVGEVCVNKMDVFENIIVCFVLFWL